MTVVCQQSVGVVCECSIALIIECCGLWRFGCSMQTILFEGVVCFKVFCLVVSIDINNPCMFSLFCFYLYMCQGGLLLSRVLGIVCGFLGCVGVVLGVLVVVVGGMCIVLVCFCGYVMVLYFKFILKCLVQCVLGICPNIGCDMKFNRRVLLHGLKWFLQF